MSETTNQQYEAVRNNCRALFEKKMQDYGTAWRVLRLPSLTDQLFIKARRIRSIQEKGTQRIADDVASEFVGLVNYGILALAQGELPADTPLNLTIDTALALYDKHFEASKKLMLAKNHDYGEVWREMRISSITDLILMKIYRLKQIEDANGSTLVSEGVAANYQDIVNYAVFALIKLDEAQPKQAAIG